jgi:2-dehydro-3-deoxyphosphooctonate aldolase (KDO 8-P synthase)
MFERFTLITGPCVLENDELNLEIAHAVKRLSETFALPVIFKASFDKANRSRMDSARGPGLADGLQRLATLKEETGRSPRFCVVRRTSCWPPVPRASP